MMAADGLFDARTSATIIRPVGAQQDWPNIISYEDSVKPTKRDMITFLHYP